MDDMDFKTVRLCCDDCKQWVDGVLIHYWFPGDGTSAQLCDACADRRSKAIQKAPIGREERPFVLGYTGEPPKAFMPPICLTCGGRLHIGDGGYVACPACANP